MKKASLLAVSASALLLWGCAADDTLSQQPEERCQITFNATAEDATRGKLAEAKDLKDNGFSIYANTVRNGVATTFMENVAMIWDENIGEQGAWIYSPLVYWPVEDGVTVDFYPVFTDRNTVCTYGYDKKPHVTYTVPTDDVRKHTDYLWASPILAATKTDRDVKFSFTHVMAGVKVTVNNVKMTDALLTALQNQANYAGNPNGDEVYQIIKNNAPVTASDFKMSVEKVTLSGKFPVKGEIDPNATDKNEIWQYDYNDPYENKTFTLTSAMLQQKDDANPEIWINKDDSNIFLLPWKNQINCELTVTFNLVFRNAHVFEFSFTKQDVPYTFTAGKLVNMTINPNFTDVPKIIKKI